jgi:phage terminase large subunit GpA-like protein
MPPTLSDIEYLETLVEQKATDEGVTSMVDAIHGKRSMPAGTPLPGIVDVYRTPYLLELMDNMSPSSPVRRTTCMKSVQSALTWFAECVIAAWMEHWPTKLLYLSATKEAIGKWTKRLEALIDSMDLRRLIVASNTDRKTRTTGDKALSKTFKGGGALEMGSLQSSSDIASDSVQVAIADEVDRAPEHLRSGEGNFLRVLSGRLEAFLWKAKLLAFSTPTTWDASLIYKEFKLGDQREYFVPCKHCGHMFYMQFKQLVPVYDKNKLLDYAWLKCPECGGKHVNSDKTWMLAPENGAKWIPQAVPSMKYHRSYHISKMMVPVGLATWTNIYQEYLNAQAANDMAPFFNLQLGLPYKPKGVRPNHGAVMDQRGPYGSREIPDGVLFLTCAMDVQRGSKTDTSKPPRLEMEILGHGQEFRTWGIEYKVFTGRIWRIDKRTGESVEITGGAAEAEKYKDSDDYEIDYDLGLDNPYRGAWAEFHDWAVSNFTYTRSDGTEFRPLIVFIDSGDGDTMHEVYAFCQRPEWKNTFPIKGTSVIRRKKKGETGDEADDNSLTKYRPHREPDTREIKYYTISTWHYKAHLYNNLTVKRQPFDPQAPHFCDFPQDYTEEYFKQLTANERYPDGSYHDLPGQSCEALDVRVYGLCAADVALSARMVWYRKQMLAGQTRRPVNVRRSQFEIEQMIDIKYTLRMLERETARKQLK